MTVQVPNNVEPDVIKRELAKRGYQVVKSYVPHNTITNERSGRGVLQIRAPNDRYHEEAKNEIENIGLKIESNGVPRRAANVEIRWK
jgi:2'-5' RNA ligase